MKNPIQIAALSVLAIISYSIASELFIRIFPIIWENYSNTLNYSQMTSKIIAITKDGENLECDDSTYVFYSKKEGLFCDNLLNITTDYHSIVNVDMSDLTTNQMVGVNEIMNNN